MKKDRIAEIDSNTPPTIIDDIRKRSEFLSLIMFTIRKKPNMANKYGKNAVSASALFTARRLEKKAKIASNKTGISKDVLRSFTDFSANIFTT